MRILLLSFYYPPDLSAGSFRAAALVRALCDSGAPGLSIDVLTTMPNRYKSFEAPSSLAVQSSRVAITRVALPAHASDMSGQARAFVTYARAVWRATRGSHYDLVVATSSRLMTAALGAALARRCRSRLYLDIRDIFADTIGDVLPGAPALLLGPVIRAIERWTMRSASHINLVSLGFRDYFTRRFPAVSYSYFSNGIDDEFLDVAAPPSPPAGQALRVLYAGNLGEGQGLHRILPGLVERTGGRVHFTVIGDGGRRRQLESALEAGGLRQHVTIKAPMPRAQLLQEYQSADVLFVHLNAFPAFLKVLPSKLFEYGAIGKPLLAGVGGYAAEFVRTEIDNAAVFTPCDPEGAEQALMTLRLGYTDRVQFKRKFARAVIMRAMAEDVLRVASGH